MLHVVCFFPSFFLISSCVWCFWEETSIKTPKGLKKREKKIPPLNIFLSSFVLPVVILLRKQLLVYLGYWLDAWRPITTTTTAAAAVIKGARDESGLIQVESSTSWLQSVLTTEDRTAISLEKKIHWNQKLGEKDERSRKADWWLRPFSLLAPLTWQLTQRCVGIQLWTVNSVAVCLKERGKLRAGKHAGCTAMF